MTVYYNEIDPYAAQWLRNLIAAGHIAPGVVDERDIRDVCPDDLRGFPQCHFFAGIGVWSYALRLAQWPDTRPVWTGSCPCQPFSVAGVGAGFGDERHLWPFFHALIEQCRPAAVLGEQVASKDADPWIDLVQADMEALDYAFGAVPFPSAGVGAPHIRDRLYWVAYAKHRGREARESQRDRASSALPSGVASRLANNDCKRFSASARANIHDAEYHTESCGSAFRVANAIVQPRPIGKPGIGNEHAAGGRLEGAATIAGLCSDLRARPINGFWRDADWLGCRDGKWRPVEPGTFPLVDGAASRVGRLRAYGNAINARQAQIFIECVMECQP